MANRDSILKDALTLPADERAELIDTLLSSLDEPDNLALIPLVNRMASAT